MNNVSIYPFIFLKTLRKILKYVPANLKNYVFYRCVPRLVDQNSDPNNPKFIPYCEGNNKVFILL